MGEDVKIKKSTLYYLFGIVLLIVIVGFFMLMVGSANVDVDNTVGGNPNGDVQKVVIGMKNFNYYPNTIKVKVGKPVSISLDESVYGCLRSFNIKGFGISKYLRTPQDTIEFTPDKLGTYTFACSMGMGTGTLIVE